MGTAVTFDFWTIFYVAAVLLVAGFFKGLIGFGLPSISMGLLGLTMPPAQAAALLIVPNVVTNIQQALFGPALRPLLRRLGLFLAAIAIGAALYAAATGARELRWATTLLGATLVVYALLGLGQVRFRLSARHEGWVGILCGLATGAMTIATGVFVIPSGPFLQALDLEKSALVQALGLTFLTASLSLGAVLLWKGGLSGGSWAVSATALMPALLGVAVGRWLLARISADAFRRLFYLGLLALGVFLTWKG